MNYNPYYMNNPGMSGMPPRMSGMPGMSQNMPPPTDSSRVALWAILFIIGGVLFFLWWTGRLNTTQPTLMPLLLGDDAPTFAAGGSKNPTLPVMTSSVAKLPKIYAKSQYKLLGDESGNLSLWSGDERIGLNNAEDCQAGAANMGAVVAVYSKGNGGRCRWYKRVRSASTSDELKKRPFLPSETSDDQLIEISEVLPIVS